MGIARELNDTMKRKEEGFSFVEMMIVLIIITIIIAIALPNLRRMRVESNIAETKGDLRTLQTALESYYIHNNLTYVAGLSNLTSATPRIVNTLPTDPFNTGNNYGYSTSSNGNYYVIYSVGLNGNGSASVNDSGNITEINPSSCIYVSNAGEDPSP